MFRRKWSALPPDPAFPSDLKKLGYYINEKDEIRSIENPNYYFKYFISRNERYNERQRFAFNQAIEEEIHARLTALGLRKVLLPLGTTDPRQPHVPIFASSDMSMGMGMDTAQAPAAHLPSRVVLIFGETVQDLGVIAHRVIGGPGGINQGSMVSVVSALRQQRSSAADARPPGIVLANTGQLLWWEPPRHRQGQKQHQDQDQDQDQTQVQKQAARAMTRIGFDTAPMRSAVHEGTLVNLDAAETGTGTETETGGRRNRIPGNGDVAEHVRYVFETVVPGLVPARAKLDIVAVGDAADAVERYFDWGATWSRWRDRIGCFANVGGYYPSWEVKCEGFRRFLRDKTRAYMPSLEPLGTILSGPDGNPRTTSFTELGCPVFSGGTEHFTELLLIKGQAEILTFLQEVALADGDGYGYRNPDFHVVYTDVYEEEKDEYNAGWKDWQEQEDQQPVVEVLVPGGGGTAATAAATNAADEKLEHISEEGIVEIDDIDNHNNNRDGGKGNRVDDVSTKGVPSDGKEEGEEKGAKAAANKPESKSEVQGQDKIQNGGAKDGDQPEQLETRLRGLGI